MLDNTWDLIRIVDSCKERSAEVAFDDKLKEIYAQALRLQAPRDLGSVFFIQDFIKMVGQGWLTDYDGNGYLADFEGKEHDAVRCWIPALIQIDKEKYPFVFWYNK